MGHETKLLRSIGRIEPRRFGLGLLLGCFVATFAYFSMAKFDAIHFMINVQAWQENAAPPRGDLAQTIVKPQQVDVGLQKARLDENAKNKAMQSQKKTKSKLMCDFSQKIMNFCELEGDIRIVGKNSTVLLVPPEEMDGPDLLNRSIPIKPYPRKEDPVAMADVSELIVKSSDGQDESPACTDYRDVTALVFSDRGYTGNYFHDFTDVFVPLFLTSRQYKREVQFLIKDYNVSWIGKFLPIFKSLSRYDMIDFDRDNKVRCYQHVTVGLTSHGGLSIDPSRSPRNLTAANFTQFMREAYKVKRESIVPLGFFAKTLTKPRVLVIARAKTRRFVNLKEIVRLGIGLGFEMVVMEGAANVAKFARIVNSCDVMMGVHGAGLTNMVFLPVNSVFIQILPWGGIDEIAGSYFRKAAQEMKLNYLQYDITIEESTLIEQYPRDDPVFTDPGSIRDKGWDSIKDVFLDKQSVRLNVTRFEPFLRKSLELLHR